MPSWWVRYSKERKAKSDRESIIGSFHRKYIGSRAQRQQHNDTTLGNGLQYKGGSQSPLPSKQVSRYQSFGERPQPQRLPLPHNRIIGCPDSGDSALIVSSVDRSSKNSLFRSPPKPWHGKIGQCAAVGERDMASDLNSSDISSDSDDRSDSPQASDYEKGIKSDIASSSGLKQKDQPPPVNKSNSREVLKPANISSNNQASLASPKRRLINSTIAHLHIPHQGAFLSAPDSSISSPSRSPMRVFGHEPSINGGPWLGKPNADLAVGSGQCSNQGSGYNLRHNSVAGDIACQPFCLQSRCSPECSPLPCSRMTSPGPSSRVHSGAASPLHPPAGGSAAESPTAWPDDGKKQSHPLPFPPAMVSSPSPLTSSGTSPWIPHSPSGTANPPSPGSCWKKGRLLGRGTYGHVYLGFNSESGEMCAMKEVILFSDDATSRESVQQLVQEIALLSRLHHTNIVQYYGSETIDDKLYIFLEYVSGGSINKILQEYGQLGEAAIRSYTQQILSGLAYLHGKNTLHRDIKGANILVDPNGRVKLADFGMAKHITGKSCPLSFKGSPYWMAPEVIKNSGSCNLAVDIWSLGCTVLEMATTKPPWSQYEGVAAMFKIGNSDELPAIPDHLSDEGKDFVGQCLQRNPCDRPTAAQLLEHPFVKNSSSAFLSAEPTDSIPALTRAVGALGFGNSGTSYLNLSGAVNHSKNQKDVPGSSDGYVARNISCPVSPIGSPLSRSQSPQFCGRSSPSPISSPRATSGASTPLGGGDIGTSQYHRKTINYQHENMGMVSRPQNTSHQNGNGYQ